MTMRYAHLAPEHLRTAVSRLEGLTSPQPAKDVAASAQEPARPWGSVAEKLQVVGSPGWSRTSDFLINSQALYQLSYRGVTSDLDESYYSPRVASCLLLGSARRGPAAS